MRSLQRSRRNARRWPRRDVEYGQNALERDRIKDRRNANHMPTRMNDLDRDSEGKRQAYRQERRVVLIAAATASTVAGIAPTNQTRLADFGKHVQAVGRWLARTRDVAFAHTRLQHYRQMADDA
jgi:hypothetical protein